MKNYPINIKTAVRITESNGATENSRPYIRNSIHQKGESQKGFFKNIILCFYSVAPLLRVSNAFLGAIIAFLLLSAVAVLPAIAGDLENRVKTAYVYNFTKFIEWPGGKSASGPIRICFVGNDPLRTAIGELKNRQVNGRSIKIVRFSDIDSLPPCEIIYISRSEASQLYKILERLQGVQVLTVSDIPGFSKRGGMIGFVTENERVKIEANPRVIRQAGLKVSAKLLEVARVTE